MKQIIDLPLAMGNTDFYFKNAISFITLMPVSIRAELWVKENITLESWQDKNEISIESVLFKEIYDRLMKQGMIIKPSL